MPALDLTQDLPDLLQAIVDVESVSGNEAELADLVQEALSQHDHLEVVRLGNNVVARTDLGRSRRIVVAGHLDTVPVANNLPGRRTCVDGVDLVMGRGSCDMKGGVAVALQLAAQLEAPRHDVTWVFYENEEVAAPLNGLGKVLEARPELLAGDFAVLMEPTSARIEGGCQGTMRFWVTTRGRAAHSARGWTGHNAIHDMAEVLQRLADFKTEEVEVDGLRYREGLNAVQIRGGVAGNVIPDECAVHVNYRFAPHRTTAEAEALMRGLFDGYEIEVVDLSPAARPGLDDPAVAELVAAVGTEPGPKYGWTDVARFSMLGMPAVNYGPADPNQAHTDDESCPVQDLHACAEALRRWLAPTAHQEDED